MQVNWWKGSIPPEVTRATEYGNSHGAASYTSHRRTRMPCFERSRRYQARPAFFLLLESKQLALGGEEMGHSEIALTLHEIVVPHMQSTLHDQSTAQPPLSEAHLGLTAPEAA